MKKTYMTILTLTVLLSGCSTDAPHSSPPIDVGTSPSDANIQWSGAPTTVQGISMTDNSPASMGYFPTDVTAVTANVYRWLNAAAPTHVVLPKQPNVPFEDYFGPSRLYFHDQNGDQITVAPAFYIKHEQNSYHVAYIPDVITYQDGNDVTFLGDAPLYKYIEGNQWTKQFAPESYSDDDTKAVQAVLQSSWGGGFKGLFPTMPSVKGVQLPQGGPDSPAGKANLMPATTTTYVKPEGSNREVVFTEEWGNGAHSRTWSFTVSKTGRILKHAVKGDLVPQDWH